MPHSPRFREAWPASGMDRAVTRPGLRTVGGWYEACRAWQRFCWGGLRWNPLGAVPPAGNQPDKEATT